MDSKKIRTSLGRFFGLMGLNIFSLIIRFVPAGALYSFATRMSGLGWRIAAKQRRTALESLEMAFGKEKSAQEIEGIARDCFTFIAKSALELMFLMDKPQLLRSRVKLVGKQNLDAALSSGKGAILVSAHFGNFPLMLARLALEGYPTAGIMRPMRDSRVENIFQQKRKRLGINTIYSQPRKACVENSLRALRNNSIVFIPIDQNFGTAGVFVNFFGIKAATATGPVVLAQRTKAALMPCFIVRQLDDTHHIIFEPPLGIEPGKDDEDTVILNIQRLTDVIEAYIRRYPQEWGWIHKRWKSKPA